MQPVTDLIACNDVSNLIQKQYIRECENNQGCSAGFEELFKIAVSFHVKSQSPLVGLSLLRAGVLE